ncbi:hypothetical protein [Gulosibacter molinativorax]|uniref:ATP synthase protein I2 n=1 Tax=Gulosibacter molinativorax TaxID=256821 RepID=A0ABT7C3Q2_9MICO|nr:hypothetical protein [Gulosibacter molinativorax]MDJ1369877.1 hypothetical protein [Gulosibacter molinativorax]QUY61842.1 Hypotetical protein [Gulosibacter molinativorax]
MSPDNSVPSSVPIMRKVLRWSLILMIAVAVVGGIVGWFVAGWSGVWSAVVAAAVVLLFTAVTAISIIFAAKLPSTYFMAVILGAWLLKLIAFVGVLAVVRAFDFTHDWMLWSTMLVALVGALAIDVVVVLRSRQPYVSEVDLPGPEKKQ